MTKLRTLIVDDESELRKSVASILKNTNLQVEFEIEEASNGLEALEKVKSQPYGLILMDVRMPEMNGLEALKEIKEHDPRTFVVIMTAHSNLNDAVVAIKDGAYDYVEKPVSPDRLTEIVRKSLEAHDMITNLTASNPIFDDDIESEIVGHNTKMKEVFNLIYKLCKVETTVLIRGENGTGKELVARAIHFNSPRKSGAFVAINCGAIPENLMESEFFGHEKGAFTGAVERKIGKFQLANNGTLFLDEIGELKPEMQVKILRALQEKKFTPVGSNREVKTNARIIAATNRNLEKMMETSEFREDLFYRLNVMPIFLPPLRERADDIPALAMSFLQKFSREHGKNITAIEPECLDLMKKYRWPGNIRELENIIERAFIVESSSIMTKASLPDQIKSDVTQQQKDISTQPQPVDNTTAGALNFEVFKEQAEKEFIVSALKANKGKINQTVAQANIPKNTLLRKIRKYNINVKDFS
ncbi:sigma-54-dependent transcriptional regulator [Pseudobdellovibrio exovorus]|uniref:Acetoacetate metabolism regulatory protein atoC n=1 Tax=Pseudobdellovibrio exovorus JSS TaxID=1184267 RepID=M4VAU1_9BACT|nr:sigma-54 dependent transcriptional regulator [Pseudobdellovibrio exovorus]AGH95141.1 acetoacetate metabolism regulatory protein atoC [Pseudobdellovibrio exovorus JSS]